MAESVARVKILAQVEGLEGFDKLKSAFRGLQQAIGPADSELNKARKQILEFGKAGAQTEQVLKGQVEALKALQAQATIGGTVYRKLGQDVKALGGAYKEAATGVKEFSDAQLRSQIVGSKPGTFDRQIAALRRGLQDLSVYSKQYSDALTDIQRRQLPFNAALGRQNVIAGFQAYQQGGKGGSALPEMPNTTAALNQQLTEANQKLVNLTRGGEDWIRVSREIANVQRQLNQEFANPAVEAARRRLEASRSTSSGFLQFSTGLEDRLAIEKSIARNQRKVSAGALMQAPEAPMREISALYQSIGNVGMSRIGGDIDRMGKSYNEVAQDIRNATKASDGSINSLQAQRQSWEALRNTLGSNKTALREVTKEIAAVDRQLEKRGVGGRRGGAAQIGQGAGALAASGIFGGPEGFLGSAGGAAIGALVGGPAGFATGAFLGGSVGAYGGMARQGLGGMSTYAADISKQEIALKGITKTQQEYARALAASAAVTRDFNVPQLEATRGMTQLSAAVIGAGGKVADAEVVFRNVTAAIKASGGSSEDVQGSLTALAQIFSKGKVSAEELQGQLGERLPGAVTMFAKATGRTLPQLQKDLEQGVVGLADLMKFVVSEQGLGQFEQRAKTVAKSSAEAGARMTVAFNETRRAIGEALLPLGAQIQDSLANALRDATPALVEFAKGLAGAIKLLVDNAGAIAAVTKAILGIGAMAAAGFGFVKAAQGIALVTKAIADLGGVLAVARLAASTLGATLLAIPGIGWAAAAIVGVGLLTKAVYDNNDTFKSWVDNIGGVVANDFKAAVNGMKEDAKSAFDFIGDLLPDYEQKSAKSQQNVSNGWASAFKSIRDGAFGFVTDIQNAFAGLFDKLPPWARKFLIDNAAGTGGGLAVRVANYVKDASGRAVAKGAASNSYITGTEYMGPGGSPGSSASPESLTRWETAQQQKKDKAAADAARLAADQQKLDEAVAKAEIQLQKTVFDNQMELQRRVYDYAEQRLKQQRDLWALSFEGVKGDLARSVVDLQGRLDAIRKESIDAQAAVRKAEMELETAKKYEGVTSQGLGGRAAGGGQIIEYLTGDRSSSGYRADHGGANYHEHLAFKTAEQMRAAMEALKASGIKIGSTTGGRHAAGSYHYRGQAFDVPASQVPVGQEQALSRRVREVLAAAGFSGAGVGGRGVAGQVRRDVGAEGNVATAQAGLSQARAMAALTQQNQQPSLANEAQAWGMQQAQGLRNEANSLEKNNDLMRERLRLEAEGLRPELIESRLKILEYEDRRRESLELLQPLLDQAISEGNTERAIAYQEAIDGITSSTDRLTEATRAQAEMQTAQGAALNAYVGQLRQQLNEMTNIENVVISMAQTIESELSSAMSNAVSVLVSGTGSVKQVFADMFKNIGASFVQMATQMIAKALIMKVLGILGGAFGGGGGNFSSAFGGGGPTFNPGAFSMPSLMATGGVMSSNGVVPLKRYAAGGVAKSPQMAIYGERGPEAYVPLPDGRNIPVKMQQRSDALNRYKPMGATGTMTADGEPGAAGAGGAGTGAAAIDVRYSVERINNVDYVTAEQFQQGMQQAAAEGASRGQQLTLRRLQQSPATRRRIGV